MAFSLRIGIVGMGYGARVHLPAFQSIPGVKVTAISDAGSGRAQQVAAEAEVPHPYNDWRKMLRDQNLDVVSVAVPPAYQAEVVLAALESGKHVLCEKPFGRELAEAEKMTATAQASGLVNAVGFQFRMEPGIAELKRQFLSGAIGQVQRFDVSWLTGGRADRARPWSWHHDRTLGGGVLDNFGSHIIDYLEWVCKVKITSIFAQAHTIIGTREDSSGVQRDVTAEDSCDLICRLSNGGMAILTVSNCYQFGPGHKIEIYGDEGRLVFRHDVPFLPAQAKVFIETNNIELTALQPGKIAGSEHLDSRMLPFLALARLIVEAISARDGRDLPDFATGLRVRRILDVAWRSLEHRMELEVPS